MKMFAAALLTAALTGLVALPAAAAPQPFTVTLTLKDHRFSPSAVSVPAGRPIRVILVNQDRVIEEFDSEALDAEWKVGPGKTIQFDLGPLKPGAYPFIGEMHAETASGVIRAEAPR